MKKKKLITLVFMLVLSITIIGCEKKDNVKQNSQVLKENKKNISNKENKHYPVEIENFNKKTVYENEPKRVIAMDYNAASTLVALGLKDKIIASREAGLLALSDVSEEYRNDIKNISVPEGYLKSPIPPLEVTLSLNPDFILMDSFYFNVPDIFGEYKDYTDNGIKILVTEGSIDKKPEINDMYIDIKNLGKIFNVEEKAESLCHNLETRFNSIKSKVKKEKNYKLMGFDSGNDSPIVAGGKSLENLLIEEAGGENIFKNIDKQFATVGWEDVISKNPDYIILHETPEDKGAKNLISILKNNKELQNINAIKNEKFIIIPTRYMFSGIYSVDAFEKIVEELNR